MKAATKRMTASESQGLLVDRRGFLGTLFSAGALVLGARMVPQQVWAVSDAEAATWNPDIFLGMEPDGRVIIMAHRSEMGTGIRTALPAIVADELDADWERVRIEQAIGDPRYGDQNTDGSRSIVQFYDTMRVAGATARQMLLRAGAAHFEAPLTECRTEKHEVVHGPSGKRVGYGDLVAAATKLPVPKKESLKFKDKKDYRYVGKPFPITDLKALCSGQGKFGIDAEMPGMVHASIERCPVYGGKLKGYDDSEALKVKGVLRTVVLPSFTPPHFFQALGGVAVIAENTWSAWKGRQALKVEWDLGEHESYDSEAYKKLMIDAVRLPQQAARVVGDVDAEFSKGGRTHEATYYVPQLAHAPMEPPAAVAEFRNGKVVAHAATQNPQAAQQAVANAMGIEEADVECHVTLLGGGFGRKSKPDYVVEAAMLSKEVGKPVKITWSREEDIQFDYFHAPAAMYLKAAMDEEGRATALLHRSAFPSIMSTFMAVPKARATWELDQGWKDVPWAIPNIRAENAPVQNHARIGWLRSVCNIFHAFAMHSFVDELAHLAGRDPVAYLLECLGPDRQVDLAAEDIGYANYGWPLEKYPVDTGRLRRVIELAAEKSDWKNKKSGDGRGWGIAAHRSFLSYVAAVVEVSVDEDGAVTIPRVDMAVDVGLVINPDRVKAQFEGSAVFGASIALMSEITAKQGRIEQSNFDGYRVARITEAPRQTNVHVVESDAPPGGVGEPGVPPVMPAIANAIFAATGKRIRELPIGAVS